MHRTMTVQTELEQLAEIAAEISRRIRENRRSPSYIEPTNRRVRYLPEGFTGEQLAKVKALEKEFEKQTTT